jgi:hypothetical protein
MRHLGSDQAPNERTASLCRRLRHADILRFLAEARSVTYRRLVRAKSGTAGAPTLCAAVPQGFFTAIYIDTEGRVALGELTEAFAALLADDLVERIEAERASQIAAGTPSSRWAPGVYGSAPHACQYRTMGAMSVAPKSSSRRAAKSTSLLIFPRMMTKS